MLNEPQCYTRKCKHFSGANRPDGTEESERVVCLAFPQGIPDEVAYGDNLHTEPLPGQVNDIVFEKEGA